jgi:hypothetical protein
MNLRTKKSKCHEEGIEITLMKSDMLPWPEPDDDKFQGKTRKPQSSQISLVAEVTAVSASAETLNNSSSCNSLDVNFDNNSILSELSSVSSLDGPIEDIYCKRRNGSKCNRPRSPASKPSRLFQIGSTTAPESSRPSSTTSSTSSLCVFGNVRQVVNKYPTSNTKPFYIKIKTFYTFTGFTSRTGPGSAEAWPQPK